MNAPEIDKLSGKMYWINVLLTAVIVLAPLLLVVFGVHDGRQNYVPQPFREGEFEILEIGEESVRQLFFPEAGELAGFDVYFLNDSGHVSYELHDIESQILRAGVFSNRGPGRISKIRFDSITVDGNDEYSLHLSYDSAGESPRILRSLSSERDQRIIAGDVVTSGNIDFQPVYRGPSPFATVSVLFERIAKNLDFFFGTT